MSATPSDAAAGSTPAGDSISAIIELYKKDVDRSLLRSRLALTPEQRLIELMRMQRLVAEVARAGRETRRCARAADE
jgi:hypothetical protein